MWLLGSHCDVLKGRKSTISKSESSIEKIDKEPDGLKGVVQGVVRRKHVSCATESKGEF